MPRPTLDEQVRFLTTRLVALRLGIGIDTLLRRIAAGMYPPPSMINDQGVHLFSPKWFEKVGTPPPP